MSQIYDSTKQIKAGEIILKETKRGLEFHAFNFQRQRLLHVGTVIGATYEKVAPVLRQPEPSFSLPQSELAAVEECGAEFIRIVLPDKSMTYSIAVKDFRRHGEAYYNAHYGPQVRCALGAFQHTTKVGKRSPLLDNPPIPAVRDIVQDRQISLF